MTNVIQLHPAVAPSRTILDYHGSINDLPVMLVLHPERGYGIAIGATNYGSDSIEIIRAAIAAYDAATGGTKKENNQ